MRSSSGLFAAFFAVVMVATPVGGFAAGLGCNQARDVVERAICASPKLSALDARLSVVYAALLALDPTQAAAVKRDEANWLGERDGEAAQERSGGGNWQLIRMYQQRIAFLQAVDREHAEGAARMEPVERALLTALREQGDSPFYEPKSDGPVDLLKSLQSSGITDLVSLPLRRSVPNARSAMALLPAPATPTFRNLVEQPSEYPVRTIVYFPCAGFGGILSFQGTASCRVWLLFEKKRGLTRGVPVPSELGKCQQENKTSHLATIGGVPVAIGQTTSTFRRVELQWRRWEDGKWAAPVRLAIRFNDVLRAGRASCAPTGDCTAVSNEAMRAARLYDRKPQSSILMSLDQLSPAERAQFRKMKTLARSIHSTFTHISTVDSVPYNYNPVGDFGDEFGASTGGYFPARIEGKLVLGRIGHRYSGTAIYPDTVDQAVWLVGFWRWGGSRLVPVGGLVVHRFDEGALAARLKPHPDRLLVN
ncbi:MAG: lysozyme inhibitor LprI family protein [Rhodanobacteraceae bacterium]